MACPTQDCTCANVLQYLQLHDGVCMLTALSYSDAHANLVGLLHVTLTDWLTVATTRLEPGMGLQSAWHISMHDIVVLLQAAAGGKTLATQPQPRQTNCQNH
eukprot:365409-Chlamydomonas_euryale.AAC.2